MNAAEKAWQKRKRLTNHELQRRYTARKEQANRKIERATLKLLRATAYLSRARGERQYLERMLREVEEAIEQGLVWPKAKERTKKKAGRRIEL